MLPIIGHGFGPGGSGSDEDLDANFIKRYMRMHNVKLASARNHRDMVN